MKPFLSIILPIQNEGEGLLDSFLSLDYMLSLSEFSYECVCVYMKPSQESRLVCEKFSNLVKYMRVHEIKDYKGWNSAFIEGMQITKGNIRMFLDPNAVSAFSERDKFLQKIRDGYECVIGVDGEEEGDYAYPKSIPRMIVYKEDLVSVFEKEIHLFHKRRVALAEVVGILLRNKNKIYAIPLKKDIIPLRSSFVETLVNKKKLFSLGRAHKKRIKLETKR